MRKYIFLLLLLLHRAAFGQGYEYCYWLDDHSDERYYGTSETSQWSLQLDVADLSETLHHLHVQVKDTAGRWSSPRSTLFLRVPLVKDIKARYWFDNKAIIEATVTNGAQSIDVSGLSDGLHFFHYQVKGSGGAYSPVRTSLFLKSPVTADLTARYWFDDEEATDTLVTTGVQSIDVSGLSDGLHFFHYQVKGSGGAYSPVRTSLFLKSPVTADLTARYWFDDGKTTETTVTSGVQSINVSGLSQGLHFFHYQIKGSGGAYSPVRTALFINNKRGDIVRYDYWVNNDTENLRVKAGLPSDSLYCLNDSLEVESYPIRPEAFHFEVNEGTPYIYGKNKLHARFYNSNSAFAEDSAMYIDGGSRREVTDVLPLEAYTPRTDATPEADSIRWYQLVAYASSRPVLLVSQSCTVQLFSPEGEELLYATGEAATDTLRCNASSDGYYYVALHSVTGGDSLTTIRYMRENLQHYRLEYFVDGEFYAADSVARGDHIIAMAEPVKENRRFSGWRDLPSVMPDSNVTARGSFEYMVDYMVADTVLWRTGYYYGDEIDDSPEPEKEWYEFEEWDGLPTTMPARDIAVIAKFFFLLELGDVNGDGRVSVADITVLTNHIMKLPNTQFVRDAADVNGDGRISVVDVTMTTNKILDNED